MTTHTYTRVRLAELLTDRRYADRMPLVARFGPGDPAVTILKVEHDRHGFDVLYQHNGAAPRWRGFDEPDSIDVRDQDEV